MKSFAVDVEDCREIRMCFGKVAESFNPILFAVEPSAVKVMVVTEQPRGDRVSKDTLKEKLYTGHRNRVPQRLRALLGEEFCASIRDEQGPYYWTHFIKCPGEFRKSKKRRQMDLQACANQHLRKELAYLRPALIISLGSMASKWLLDEAGKENDWREYVIDHLRKGEAAELPFPLEKQSDRHNSRVIFLFHPSERSGLGWFIDQQLRPIIDEEIRFLQTFT